MNGLSIIASICLLASAAAASYIEPRHLIQQPFLASSSKKIQPSARAFTLHRICLPSSRATKHWPALLESLSELSISHAAYELDVWSQPRKIAELNGEEQTCLDFTYPDQPEAVALLDGLVHGVPQAAEIDWAILADRSELSKVADNQKSSQLPYVVSLSDVETNDPFHNGYHPLHNITAWLSWQVARHPELAELVELGITYESNLVQGIRLGRKSHSPDGKRRQVVIVAAAHGREWISTSVALYLVSYILQNPSILEKVSVLIVPVLNPDGYLYTWSADRFFRKNRQPVNGKDWWGRHCYGIDVSRNFPAFFKQSQRGSSPCNPMYAGDAPLSTAESTALANLLKSEEEGVIAFLDLHSYGQMLLYPWLSCAAGAAGEGSIPDEEDMSELTLGAARAAKSVHNRQYRAGRGCETMYGQDGNTVDFSYSQAGVKWSLELELRDEGSYGFLLPPDQIRPTGEEVAASVAYWLAFVIKCERL